MRNRSGIEERQKDLHIPAEVWEERWDSIAWKREKKNDDVMKHKRKPKDEA